MKVEELKDRTRAARRGEEVIPLGEEEALQKGRQMTRDGGGATGLQRAAAMKVMSDER